MANDADNEDYAVIGWLFEAKDHASDAMLAIDRLVKAVGDRVTDNLGTMVDGIETTTKFVGGAFKSVFGDLIETVIAPLDYVVDSLADSVEAVSARWRTFIDYLTQTEVSFRDLGPLIISTSVRLGELVQKFITIENITKGLEAVGGLFGAMFGPFALILRPVLRLLAPILEMIEDGLMPAVQTFTSILATSFNPLFELAEFIAQSLAPQVQKFLTPLVEGLEIVAIHAASFVSELLRGDRAANGLASLFQNIGPIVMDIFRTMGGLAEDLLPVALDFFKALAPVAMEVVKVLAVFLRDNTKVLAELLRDALPPLAKAFTDILRALLPLIEPVTKIVTAVVEELLAPLTVAAAKSLGAWISNTVVPFINENMPKLLVALEQVLVYIDKAGQMLGRDGLGKTLSDFKTLYLDPLVQAGRDMLDQILDQTTIGKLMKRVVQGFLDAVKGLMPGGEASSAIGDLYEQHGVWGVLQGAITGKAPGGMAHGAVVPSTPGGVLGVVGEGPNDEVVMPLTRAGVQAVIPPLLREAIEIPGIDSLLMEVQAIRKAIATGTFMVKIADSDVGGMGARAYEGGDALRAPGLAGIGG